METVATALSSKLDLTRGEQYWWMILAMAKGRILAKGEGQFLIMTQENEANVSKAEVIIEKAYPEDSAESLISLGLLYQSYELYDDAVNVVKKLNQRYPQNKNIESWLKSLTGFLEIK
jgi:hypothetical protein